MGNYIIRSMTAADAPQAARLWSMVFGDDEALVQQFFTLFADEPNFAACAELDGEIVAAAYCPCGTDYIAPDGSVREGAYLYAVATHPDHRKRQLGMYVCQWLRDHTHRAGRLLFTRPSEESLYPWYAEKIDAVPALGGRQLRFARGCGDASQVRTLDAAEYDRLRTVHMTGTAYVRHDRRWQAWEQLLHKAYGGGYYAVGEHIADVYCDGETLQINELLPHPTDAQAESAAQALMSALDAQQCVCMVYGDGHYVSVGSPDGTLPDGGWFGVCYG